MPNGSYGFEDDVPEQPKGTTTGYPKGSPKYQSSLMDLDGVDITPDGHWAHHMPSIKDPDADKATTFLRTIPEQFTRDINDNKYSELPVTTSSFDGVSSKVPVFSGSTTNPNPLDDKNKADILTHGYHEHEKKNNDDEEPRVSPLLPFTRTEPDVAQSVNYKCYNRTKLPVADLEWRKGFRHIFITRPECYIMGMDSDSKVDLSEQCQYDRDFLSAYHKFPEVLKILSPYYVTHDFDNFNYLLSNRVMGLTTNGTAITHDESVQKSIEGITVQPAKLLTSSHGATIDLTFRDTKTLEVYNCLRLWMLYMYKTYKGILAPSYNGYHINNSYNLGSSAITIQDGNMMSYAYHPYDRALDYCASLFDIVTNESGTKILYWCKYYGIYPVSASPQGLSNTNNGPIAQEMTVSSQFKYQYKLEMSEQTFIEFNYNAGLLNYDGSQKYHPAESQSWLYYEDTPYHRDDLQRPSKTYMGAAGMFTGTPYIILNQQFSNVDRFHKVNIPMLRFRPIIIDEKGDNKHTYHLMNNYIENNTDSMTEPSSYGGSPSSVPYDKLDDVTSTYNTSASINRAREQWEGYEQARWAQRRARQRNET